MEFTSQSGRVRFDPFELDLQSGELYRRGHRIRLQHHPFQVLALLLEQPGNVVTREELHRKLWPTDTFVDFEAGLNTAIKKLREALADSPESPRFVETLPRRGYRFIASVQRASERPLQDSGTHSGVSRASPVRMESRSRALWIAALGVGLLGVLLIGLKVGGRRQQLPEGVNRGQIQSIAVLPFKALAQGSNPYVELGMADALITKLSNIRQIVVRPTGSILKYTKSAEDPLAAGRELKVDAVLDGTVQRADERIRLTVRLVRVQDGKPLWAESFDEEWTHIFALQDSISERVARALTLQLTGEERERLAKRYTENTEAYRAYLIGRYYWNRRTGEGDKKAIEYFAKAVNLDPAYPLAYVGLADSYALLPFIDDSPPKESFARARAAAMKAVEIDGTVAEAHASLGFIILRHDFDWTSAEREFKRALELNPNYATAHQWYGASYLSPLGRHTEAITETKRAQELDPLSLMVNTALGRSFYYARRYDEAVEQYRKTLEIEPNFWVTHLFLGKAYEQKGMYEEAIAELQKAEQVTIEPRAVMAYTYAVSGKRGEATKVLNELRELSRRRYVPSYHIANIYAALGEKDEAFAWLEKAHSERDGWLPWLRVEPMVDSLRSDPRFQHLLRRIGLPP